MVDIKDPQLVLEQIINYAEMNPNNLQFEGGEI